MLTCAKKLSPQRRGATPEASAFSCRTDRDWKGLSVKIAVINTGGTISCTGNPLSPMSAEAFAGACRAQIDPILAQPFPELQIVYSTDPLFPDSANGTLDSTNLQPVDWCRIARQILLHYAEFDGWVVLHGTDTMEFTGAALPFLLSAFDAHGFARATLSKPVVLTGSQLPLFHQTNPDAPLSLTFNSDALRNICGAIAAAQSGIPEVCVFFDGALYRGCRVQKVSSGAFAAFASPNCPPLGRYGPSFALDAALILPAPVTEAGSLDTASAHAAVLAQLEAVAADIGGTRVALLNAFPTTTDPGQTGTLLADLIGTAPDRPLQGLVLQSYGAGNFPSGNAHAAGQGGIARALAAADTAGTIIMNGSQVLNGTIDAGLYAAGSWLAKAGALSAFDMTSAATLAKLTILLAARRHNDWSIDDVKRLMQLSLVGEMESVSRLDSRSRPLLLANQAIATADGAFVLKNHPERGPELRDRAGALLWAALAEADCRHLPGRLQLRPDGNLTFANRLNQTLWQTATQSVGDAPAVLVLERAGPGNAASLAIYEAATAMLQKRLL